MDCVSLPEEVDPDMTSDQLLAYMVQGIAGTLIDAQLMHINPPFPDTESFVEGLAGAEDFFMPDTYLLVDREFRIPISFLIDVMRTSRLPLCMYEGNLMWDAHDERLDAPGGNFKQSWWDACTDRVEKACTSTQQARLLHQAAVSTDHGKKPVLVRKEYLTEVLGRRRFAFEEPTWIARADFDKYVLAYYDSSGEPHALALSDVAETRLPIFTRASAYRVGDEGLEPFLNRAKLLVSAYRMATTLTPNQFAWFAVRENGTVFDAAIDAIEAPRDPRPVRPSGFDLDKPADPDRLRFVATNGDDAVSNAERLVELRSSYDAVLLTPGAHPLDADLVTTPYLYHQAVTNLFRYGYKITYGVFNRVHLTKSD